MSNPIDNRIIKIVTQILNTNSEWLKNSIIKQLSASDKQKVQRQLTQLKKVG